MEKWLDKMYWYHLVLQKKYENHVNFDKMV